VQDKACEVHHQIDPKIFAAPIAISEYPEKSQYIWNEKKMVARIICYP
jgi:hypothetical protein